MASEAHVKDGGAYAAVLNNVYHLRHQRSCLPSEGAAGLQHHLKPRVAAAEPLQQVDETLHVIVGAGHEVTATKVYPLQLWEPLRKLFLYMCECALKHIRPALAMAMAVEAVEILGQLLRQLIGGDAKACAGCTGIVQVGADLRIFGIHTQTNAHSCVLLLHAVVQTAILRQRVKRQMTGAACYLTDLVVGIGWRVSVGRASKLMIRHERFRQRAGGRAVYILAKDGERLPQGERLEGKNYLHASTVSHALYKGEVAAQTLFFKHIHRCAYLGKGVGVYFHKCKIREKIRALSIFLYNFAIQYC